MGESGKAEEIHSQTLKVESAAIPWGIDIRRSPPCAYITGSTFSRSP
jgi:hypothetical protein